MIRLGYFTDFRARNTLIIVGDDEGLTWLAQSVRGLAREQQPFVVGNVRVAGTTLRPTLCAEVVVATAAPFLQESGEIWRWQHTPTGWLEAADLIEGVARSSMPCHQYLDDNGESMVMVSKDEYGDDWWIANAPD